MPVHASFADEPRWVGDVYAFFDSALSEYPPSFPPSEGRQEAFMVLDGPLHLQQANRFRSTRDFLVGRM